MEVKKQMRKRTIIAVSIVSILILLSVVFAINNSEDEFENTGIFNVYDNSEESLFEIQYPIIDYSEEAYVKINPQNTTRFIYLECINSTLIISDTKIYCEVD